LTTIGVKIRHDYKWGCENLVQDFIGLLQPHLVCMGLSQASLSLYGVLIAPFMVMPDFNPSNSQIYLKWILGVCFEILHISVIHYTL
jgi:hypothetical protein